jgi:1-acyl-sn-glycerol-3-phosphate acyltransferase
MFGGRSGYARLAIERGVPIVPIVTAGAGESLLVISDGRELAQRLGISQRFRLKALPVSLTFPWGLNLGLAGLAPYLPLPSKLVTAVLPAMYPEDGEDVAAFAGRVEAAMQQRMDELVATRRFLRG